MTGPCSCGALCDAATPDCQGYVKPCGVDADDNWVHSCRVHFDMVSQRSKKMFGAINDYDWEKEGPM